MTKSQAVAYRVLCIVFLGAGAFLLRFFYRVVFQGANFGEPGFAGLWRSSLVAVPAGLLGSGRSLSRLHPSDQGTWAGRRIGAPFSARAPRDLDRCEAVGATGLR